MKTLRELLPPRQFEVARLVRYGLSNDEIANLLGISTFTVYAHLQRAFNRTGCEDRAMLAVRYALENQETEKKPARRAA
jgi:DNA-binding CsgD family transcriptional regulator